MGGTEAAIYTKAKSDSPHLTGQPDKKGPAPGPSRPRVSEAIWHANTWSALTAMTWLARLCHALAYLATRLTYQVHLSGVVEQLQPPKAAPEIRARPYAEAGRGVAQPCAPARRRMTQSKCRL